MEVSGAAAGASWLGPIQFAEGMCHEATVNVCGVAIAQCLPTIADHAYDSAHAPRCAEAHAVADARSKPGNASISPHATSPSPAKPTVRVVTGFTVTGLLL